MRIAVPSGVGDVYWALTKLPAWRAKHDCKVTLCVQRTSLTRALEWSQMVDFVDGTVEHRFQPDHDCLSQGWSERIPGVDFAMWPNGALDQGKRLTEWLPDYATDQSFRIKTTPPDRPGRVVVYVSSDAVNRAWIPEAGPVYWSALIEALGEATGQVPTVIGKAWDQSFRDRVSGVEFEDLIGQTDLPQCAGILETARVVVGVISGMTILANHFRTPCIALAPSSVPPRFPHPDAWVPADAPYAVVRAHNLPKVGELAARAAALASAELAVVETSAAAVPA
jgi:Glycosyltransferase family 9 (heptosyltransferase)